MFRGVTTNRAQGTISNELRFFFSYFPTHLTLKILAGSGHPEVIVANGAPGHHRRLPAGAQDLVLAESLRC